jgi:hypothetical protein
MADNYGNSHGSTNAAAVSATGRALRVLSALLIVAAGAVHLQQYFGVYYRVIPVIGPLFLADFVLAVVLGLLLVAPIERFSRAFAALVALGGIGFAAGAIIGLEISESGALFGFHEHGYRLAVVLSIALEGAAILTLFGYLARLRAGGRPAPPAVAGEAVIGGITRPLAGADQRARPRHSRA